LMSWQGNWLLSRLDYKLAQEATTAPLITKFIADHFAS